MRGPHDPRWSEHYPDAVPIYVNHGVHHENELQDWLHEVSPGEWDLTFDEETAEMFVFLPTPQLAVLAKLRWGGA